MARDFPLPALETVIETLKLAHSGCISEESRENCASGNEKVA
jgi:hypothetical protein